MVHSRGWPRGFLVRTRQASGRRQTGTVTSFRASQRHGEHGDFSERLRSDAVRCVISLCDRASELATPLNDRFRLLTGGHRTALRRHQTLRATLDWSYELLLKIERTVLHRLAVFAGAFSLEAAITPSRGARARRAGAGQPPLRLVA
jgi:predicted ATPase